MGLFDFSTDLTTIIAVFNRHSSNATVEGLFPADKYSGFLTAVQAGKQAEATKAYKDLNNSSLKEALLAAKIAKELLK